MFRAWMERRDVTQREAALERAYPGRLGSLGVQRWSEVMPDYVSVALKCSAEWPCAQWRECFAVRPPWNRKNSLNQKTMWSGCEGQRLWSQLTSDGSAQSVGPKSSGIRPTRLDPWFVSLGKCRNTDDFLRCVGDGG